MVKVAFATLLPLASAGGKLALTWEDCGGASTHGHTDDVQPSEIVLGTDTTITGTGKTDKKIDSGSFTMKLSASMGIKETYEGKICEAKTFNMPLGIGTVSWAGMDCPVAVGPSTVKLGVKMSASLPAQLAKSDLDLTAIDQDGEQALCVNTHLTKEDSFEEIAAHVNSLGSTWQAQAPSKFADVEDVKAYLGTILKDDERYQPQEKEVSEVPNDDIPKEFDVRTAFPDCAEVSGNIRDQSSCGSCWAFGSTEAFNDRHCIATGDKTKFSVEDTTANCGFLKCMSMGCNGGQPGKAWDWFKSEGVVTGGDYTDIGKGDTCAPYSLAPCAHHVPATAKYPVCPSTEYHTPTLSKCSEASYKTDYKSDKIHATDSYSLNGVQAIQADMVKYGSATAAFTVYSDFPTYKSGVYQKTKASGKALGGHAIKLLGWGTEDGTDYWLVANSWNEMWGDHGTFKIKRGSNECGIEGQVSAGRAGSKDQFV